MTPKACPVVRLVLLVGLVGILSPCVAAAREVPATVKIAFYNIRSGMGQMPLPGHPIPFAATTNCSDLTAPLNAWGIGLVQEQLMASVGSDPRTIALGLAEAWKCGSPENVRTALGWRVRTSERNGVALVARYGFAGPEEWEQLDTSLNVNPVDTMWVLRVPVCLDAICSGSIVVFVSHWLGTGVDPAAVYERQSRATIAFMAGAAAAGASVLVGDLNVWEGAVPVCEQVPIPAGLQTLRDAGYVDAWPLLHGSAEGFTGMLNRTNCGQPSGYAWKRIDYTWSPRGFLPSSIARFGVVPVGVAAPSDHYGLVTEFPLPAPPSVPDSTAPTVTLLSPVDGLTIIGGAVSIAVAATDDIGVTRVEILEDGLIAHTLLSGQTTVSCPTLGTRDGTHTVVARAFDAAGNVGLSETHRVYVQTSSGPLSPSGSGEIVLYARNASVIAGNWQVTADPSAAGGARLWNPDASVPKIQVPLATPANYVELQFDAEALRPYRLWVRGRAERDSWANDSVYAQFSGSVDAAGAPALRIGTTAATWLGIEECSGCGLSGWGWQDNGYGAGILGPVVYFVTTGRQTIRLQQREDGISLDQIVLSPALYLTRAPGASKADTLILPESASSATTSPDILLAADGVSVMSGAWRRIADASAAGGVSIGTADLGAAKITAPLMSPDSYVELSFAAEAGREYHVWMRGRAANDSWANDSVYVQFSGTVDASGAPVARIGSTAAHVVNLEECSGCGLAGWGWQDNGYGAGVLGSSIRFAASGLQTIRIQTREDGFRFDQIVLSPGRFLTTAPGPAKYDATILRP